MFATLTRSLLLVISFCLMVALKSFAAYAIEYSIGNIQVSLTGENATEARHKAIKTGQKLAFEQWLQKRFPEKNPSQLPPIKEEEIDHMIESFEINHETVTSHLYKATFFFTFKPGVVEKWLDAQATINAASGSVSPSGKTEPTNILTSYDKKQTAFLCKVEFNSLSEWVKIRQIMQNIPAISGLNISLFQTHSAMVRFESQEALSALVPLFLSYQLQLKNASECVINLLAEGA